MILDTIITEKRRHLEEIKRRVPLKKLISLIDKKAACRDFKKAVSKPRRINLIAELKKASPSAGMLRADFDARLIAEQYEMAGSAALSVLTEEKYFLGHLSYLKQARERVSIPVLRKDFIFDPYQIYESKAWGADAVLLLADLLSVEELKDFLALSRRLGMDALAEVHSLEDLNKVLQTDADIIGVNNRNLRTMQMRRATTAELVKFIPKKKIIVSESGIRSNKDVLFLKSLGVHAVLIGETFMTAVDIPAKVREVMAQC